jgi:pimeloyl-ACP methyl ester carboxylesterase
MTHRVVPLKELIAALPELAAGDSEWNQVSRDCEVHLLTGEYDWATTPDMSRQLGEAIPGATFEVKSGLEPFPMSEDPDRFVSYVEPMLDKIVNKSAALA